MLEGHEANRNDKIQKLGGPMGPSGSPSRGFGDDDEVDSQNSDMQNYGTAQKLVSGEDSGAQDPRDRGNQS